MVVLEEKVEHQEGEGRSRRDGGSDRRSDSRDGGRRGEGRSERRSAGGDSKSMFDKAKRSRRS